jgi:hypothetical protein
MTFAISISDETWGASIEKVGAACTTYADAKAYVCQHVDANVREIIAAGARSIYPDNGEVTGIPSYLMVNTVAATPDHYAVAVSWKFAEEEIHFAGVIHARKVS